MTAVLQVEGLSRRFGGLKAVDALSFDCRAREILGIIGPNGAGKTTAVNLITGFIRPTSGRVRLHERDVTGAQPHKLARLGLVRTFQSTNVYGARTVRDNAMRGAFLRLYPGFLTGIFGARSKRSIDAVGEQIDELLTQFGLARYGESVAQDLPYGLQKILGIVIAMAAQPSLLMLDEPVAGLNGEEAEQVRTMIQQVHALGVAVIVIDHNMRFMSGLCHRIVVMHHGKELAQGAPRDVLNDPEVIAAYLGKAVDHA